MKIAAAEALAKLAREDVPDEVHSASAGRKLCFGPDYIIPNAFDPTPDLLDCRRRWPRRRWNPASRSKPFEDLASLRTCPLRPAGSRPRARWTASWRTCATNPRRVVFAEGEEEKVVRAAVAYRNAGYGRPILIGREERVRATMDSLGLGLIEGIEIHNARLSGANPKYVHFLYKRLQRRGFLQRDCQRMVNQDRNVFAACMVATGDADAMVTGLHPLGPGLPGGYRPRRGSARREERLSA